MLTKNECKQRRWALNVTLVCRFKLLSHQLNKSTKKSSISKLDVSESFRPLVCGVIYKVKQGTTGKRWWVWFLRTHHYWIPASDGNDINYTNGYTVFPRAAQKMNFSIKDFFSKCDQIRRKLRKSLMKNSFFVQSRYISFWNNLSHTQQTFICSK